LVLDRAVQTMHNIREMKASADRPITIEDLRRDVKDHFRDRVIARLVDPALDATASWARMRSMVDNLSPSERGSLAEIWYRARHAPESKAHVGIDVERSSGDNAGKMERRVIDAVQGRTAIEVKDTKGKIDQEQFAAYLDMLEKKTAGGPEIDKLKYVFTKPEGAIASLEFLAGQMRRQGLADRLSIEVFDGVGHRHIANTREEALRLLHLLASRKGE
jgi:DNA-binding helix-hairpin-helix protein with protein kinase domain